MSEGLTEIARGVRVIALETPTLPPATHTNAYVLGERDVIIVEPASPRRREQARIEAALRDAGCRVRAIYLTHHHVDHVGGVEALVAATGAEVWAHEGTAARVGFDVSRTWGEGDEITDDTGRSWRALHTPGHAPGHLCLVDPDGVVIAGDMVAGVGTILVEPSEGHMASYLASLARLREVATRLLPSHGPALEDAPAALEHYIRHRLAREARVLAAVQAHGPAEVSDLVPHAYADAPPAVWPIAALSLEAHLVKLVEDGAVRRDGARYRLA